MGEVCQRPGSVKTRARRVVRGSVCGVLVVLCAMGGCRRTSKEVTILVAGDTQGWITPCGCASNQSGGLARRAALVDEKRLTSEVLLLDVGGSAIGTTEYQQLKFESLLRGLKEMGLAAMNVGAAETEFTPEQLTRIGDQTGITWLSANLVDTGGKPVMETVLEVKRGDLTIAVSGVIDPALVSHEDWHTADAVPSLLNAFQASKANVKIVLAYFDEAGLRMLAQSLPEVDYVIGGPTGQTISPVQIGPVTMLSATNKGKFLAQLQLQAATENEESGSAKIVEVTSSLPEDQTQMANLRNYYDRLTSRDFAAHETGLVETVATTDGYAISGSSSCVACHEQDDKVWHNSSHAHAWDVLVERGASFEPHCQQCHTTGYGLPGGFSSVATTPNAIHVGCENCHGPSQAHVDDPDVRTPFQAKQQCLQCHDHENSPTFELEPYWAKVIHGG